MEHSHSLPVRLILGVLFALLFAWGVIPIFRSRFHIGCLALILVGFLGAAVCVWYPVVSGWVTACRGTVIGRTALIVLTVLVCLALILFLIASVFMAVAAGRTLTDDNATVIVLGAGIRGDRPSLMLQGRLDAAAAYLKAHPQAVCVCSGGQSVDENYTEASVMKAYLLAKGINVDRLYTEERSTSTDENVRFSQEVIRDNHLPEAVVIATQEFHQCRAQMMAKRAGFAAVGAATAHSRWYLLGSYWIRDFAGICHFILLGN